MVRRGAFPEEESPLKDFWQGIDIIRCVFFYHSLKVYSGCNTEKRSKGKCNSLAEARQW